MQHNDPNPEHRSILNTIRTLFIQSGGRLLNVSADFGIKTPKKQFAPEAEVEFDYGLPCYLYTADRLYVVLGNAIGGNCEQFWELFVKTFEIKEITPRRDDAKTSLFEYQTHKSGPRVAISMRCPL